MQVQGDTLAILKEYVLIDSDTEQMAQAVNRTSQCSRSLLALIPPADDSDFISDGSL